MDNAIYIQKDSDRWILTRYGRKISEHKLKNRALKVAEIKSRKHKCMIKLECKNGFKKIGGNEMKHRKEKYYIKPYYPKKKMKGLFDLTNIKN